MSDDLSYKGYKGSVEYSAADRVFHGKVLFIDSLLMYHGASVDELESSFEDTVDSYLAHCERTGKEPNKPYSGSFNVRTSPELHRQTAQRAHSEKTSLNDIVVKSLNAYISGSSSVNNNVTVNVTISKDHPMMSLVSTGSQSLAKWEVPEYATATRH